MSALVETPHRTPPTHRADDASRTPATRSMTRRPASRTAGCADGSSAGGAPVRGEPEPPPGHLRIDFGAHFEANYQRLVAQLYAITLDAGQAHDAVQDAYARAWRRWSSLGRTGDPGAWVRSVAVRSTIRSWRTVLGRFGVGRPRTGTGRHRTAHPAMLSALRRLPPAERRAIVLTYMAGASTEEIAAIERVSYNTVQARLARAAADHREPGRRPAPCCSDRGTTPAASSSVRPEAASFGE